MGSQHRNKPINFRPDPDEITPVKADLLTQGRELDGFLRACLRWYDHDPAAAMAALSPHWPPPRPRGRPKQRG